MCIDIQMNDPSKSPFGLDCPEFIYPPADFTRPDDPPPGSRCLQRCLDFPQIRLSVGAGEGNRTLVISLEGCCSTIELHPRTATHVACLRPSAFALRATADKAGFGAATFAPRGLACQP